MAFLRVALTAAALLAPLAFYPTAAPKFSDWSAPVNLGAVVNTASFETGPGLSMDGHLLFFRSPREGGQGLGDVYVSRRANPNDDFGWEPPVGLGPDVNTPAEEAGAEYLQGAEDGAANLYFNRAPPGGTSDLYYAPVTRDGETRGPAVLISELSHPTATDQGPTVRNDGREILFFSTRPGGSDGADLWTSTRRSVHDPWSTPVNLGTPLNSTAADQQPSLSSEGRTLRLESVRRFWWHGHLDVHPHAEREVSRRGFRGAFNVL